MLKSTTSKRVSVGVAAVLALTTVTACGSAKEGAESSGAGGEVTLKLADAIPKTHFLSQGFVLPFIAKATALAKADGHTLKIEYYPDGQLGKAEDQVTGLNTGIFELANVAPPYSPDAMPVGNAFDLPRMADSAGTLGKAYYAAAKDTSGVIYKTDFERNHIHPLGNYSLPLYQFVTVNKPISSVQALKGLKIRSGGGAQDQVISSLGGSPVALTTPEEYQALQRHTIDAGIFNLPSLVSNKTYEVTKYFTTNANVSAFVGGIAASDDSWNELPSWAQSALSKAGRYATNKFAAAEPALQQKTIDELKSKHGLRQTSFSPAELTKLDKMLQPAIGSWVADMKKQGFDGAGALTQARKAVASVSKSG